MSKVLISVAVVSKWSLLLVIFGLQIKHNKYEQYGIYKGIKRGVYEFHDYWRKLGLRWN
jgi:hypothetical protein